MEFCPLCKQFVGYPIIVPIDPEIDNLKALVKELHADLKLNAEMLAKQCDRSMELEADNMYLKQQAAFWEAKAMEYKALLENMERVG